MQGDRKESRGGHASACVGRILTKVVRRPSVPAEGPGVLLVGEHGMVRREQRFWGGRLKHRNIVPHLSVVLVAHFESSQL